MAPFGVFVCSACSGLHREINNKVKGISMSLFSEQETNFLKENGNKVSVLCRKSHLELTSQVDGQVECEKRPCAGQEGRLEIQRVPQTEVYREAVFRRYKE
jgi:hypothetical protein